MSGFDTDSLRVPLAFEQLTVSNVAAGKALTASVYAPADGDGPADIAVISVVTDALMYRCDGIAPTATVGMPQAVNTSFTVYGTLCIKKLLLIRVTADLTVNVHYYRLGSR